MLKPSLWEDVYCVGFPTLILWFFFFNFNYTWDPVHEVPKGLIWLRSTFCRLFRRILVYCTLRALVKYLTLAQGAQGPIRMHAGLLGPLCWWVLAASQLPGHPSSPRKEGGGGAPWGLAIIMQSLVSSCISIQLPLLPVVKNLLINFWKSCKKPDMLYPGRPVHFPDKTYNS